MFLYNAYNIVRKNNRLDMNGSSGTSQIRVSLNEESLLLPKADEETFDNAEGRLGCVLPQRYILGIMGTLAIVNAYTMRVCLSIAITEMVVSSNKTHPGDDTCEIPTNQSISSVTNPDMLYDWSEQVQGIILSAFYWGYIVTHLPGGILAEKFGGKHTLGLGILSTTIFTLITPLVILQTDGNWVVLALLRFAEGLGEGTTYPALNILLAKWVPLKERSRIGSLVYAGGQIGTIFSNLISGALIAYFKDWASVFYVFGSLGLLWCILWNLLCYSTPADHPFISEKEADYLEKQIGESKPRAKTPWKAIMTSVPLWALVAAQIGHDWGFYTMVTDLPKYMKDVLKFDVKNNGVWNSIPYTFMWIVSMLFGYICDKLINSGTMSITFARKFFTSVASAGPAIFMLAASYAGCDRMLAVWLFTIAMAFMGTFYCGMKVNALDLSPQYAGTLMAIVNGIGALTGVLTPYLVGELTPNHMLHEWRKVFWISFGVFNVTNIIYLIWGSGKEQWWNDPDRGKSPQIEVGGDKETSQ